MANVVYNSYKLAVARGNINLLTDTIKVALVTSLYVPNVDADEVYNDMTYEVVDTGTNGYSAGGIALTGKDITLDLVNDRSKFTADNTTWANSIITARAAVIYKDTGNPLTSTLLMYKDFGVDKSSNGGDFVIVWDPDGIVRFQ